MSEKRLVKFACNFTLKLKRLWKWLLTAGVTLSAVLTLPSHFSTLSGITVSSVLEKKPAASQHSLPEMPVISGSYTFCPGANDSRDPKLLNLLHDVQEHAEKIAFFNVSVDIDCVLGKESDFSDPFKRSQTKHDVHYSFDVPYLDTEEISKAQMWLDGGRKPEALRDLYRANGSIIAIHKADDGRNPLSRFQPHVEGMTDIVFGPYSIKVSEDDALLIFDLNAPSLDSFTMQQASQIATDLRKSQ